MFGSSHVVPILSILSISLYLHPRWNMTNCLNLFTITSASVFFPEGKVPGGNAFQQQASKKSAHLKSFGKLERGPSLVHLWILQRICHDQAQRSQTQPFSPSVTLIAFSWTVPSSWRQNAEQHLLYSSSWFGLWQPLPWSKDVIV